jgi:glutaredoxin
MIKIYATDTCVYCHALMEWFEKEGIKYEAHDANEDPTITSVPVTRIELKDGSTIEVLGFDRPAIKDALKKLAV